MIRTVLAFIAALFGMLLSVPIIVVGLPFWIVTFFTNAFSWLCEPRSTPWQELMEYHPIFGWKNKANLCTFAAMQNTEGFHFTTDSKGWRGNKINIEDSNMIVFGDSFAFGYGVNDRDCFAELNPHVRIKAAGVCGYNMVQSLLWMQRLSPGLKGKLIVWFIFYGNDLYENLIPNQGNYRMPFVRNLNGNECWEIVSDHISPDKWFYTLESQNDIRLAEICSPSFLSERAFSACEFLIGKGKNTCDEAGAQMVVVAIPEALQIRPSGLKYLASLLSDPKSFDPDLPDKKVHEICNKLDVPFVALKKILKDSDYLVGDVHWSKKGNRRVAEILYNIYQKYFSNGTDLKRELHSVG
ncbi:MAG: hypothetical protein CV087_18865 [Candidatus Brocadia sp. WS118]|nr:MAG: hypothetical protein CV087_18865 [Candidatus Brocadia sp. WS118]